MLPELVIDDSPLVRHRTAVLPEWIDGNRHMNSSYYLALVREPAMAAHEAWDYGQPFRDRTGQSNFVVESRVLYFRELLLGDPIIVTTRITGLGEKRLSLMFEIINERDNYIAALIAYMLIHVQLGTPPKVAPIPDDLRRRLSVEFERHKTVPLPAGSERLQLIAS